MYLPFIFTIVFLSTLELGSTRRDREVKKACNKLKVIHNDIDENYPRPNGCIMEFNTSRGRCCAIGSRKIRKYIFHEKFLRRRICYRIRCKFSKGKKRKKWVTCGCKKEKVKFPELTLISTTLKRTTLRPPTTITPPKPTTLKTTTLPPPPPPTTTRPKTTIRRRTTTPRQPGCVHNGVFYSPGEEIERGQTGNWCYGTICSDDGSIMSWDNFDCEPTTTPKRTTLRPPTTTTPPKPPTTQKTTTLPPPPPPTTKRPRTTTRRRTTTPRQPGCVYHGVVYPYGEIPSMSGKDGNWCYGAICGEDGNIMHWDNFDCGTKPPSTTTKHTTLRPPTTPKRTTLPPPPPPTTTKRPPTTRRKTTTPAISGCLYNGVVYPYGEIPSMTGKDGNWCYGAICGEDGNIMHWDNFDCGTKKTTTSKPPTKPPTPPPPPTTLQNGCYHNGKHFDEGEEIPEFSDKVGSKCSGKLCGPDGSLVPWKIENCDSTTPEPEIPGELQGCIVKGRYFAVGDTIPFMSETDGSYCLKFFCNEYLELEKLENYNCNGGTTPRGEWSTTMPSRMDTTQYYEPY